MLTVAPLASAYGVWQNDGPDSTSYTIAGGCRDPHDLNAGMLVDYDSATGLFGAPTLFRIDDRPDLVTHFEGITGIPDGFALAAMGNEGDQVHSALATVRRNPGPSYSKAAWVDIEIKGATANSVIDDQCDRHLHDGYRRAELRRRSAAGRGRGAPDQPDDPARRRARDGLAALRA